jgi:DNA-binding MurR/RpiR family transcriptional regulator
VVFHPPSPTPESEDPMASPTPTHPPQSPLDRIAELHAGLTPKARMLADFIRFHPRKVVFMSTRELAGSAGVSEATVIRFVTRIGFTGYTEFLQVLRDCMDTEPTLLDRIGLTAAGSSEPDPARWLISREIDNLRQLLDNLDRKAVERVVNRLDRHPSVHVIGSRLSYTLAYYMGWSLMKVRPDVSIMKGSDSTCLDRLAVADPESLAVILATSRYPTELIRVAKHIRRLGQTLVVITDSALCPLLGFSHERLVAPSRHFNIVGNPTTLCCLINHLVLELARRRPEAVGAHQEKIEQSYRENDVLFDLHRGDDPADA